MALIQFSAQVVKEYVDVALYEKRKIFECELEKELDDIRLNDLSDLCNFAIANNVDSLLYLDADDLRSLGVLPTRMAFIIKPL